MMMMMIMILYLILILILIIIIVVVDDVAVIVQATTRALEQLMGEVDKFVQINHWCVNVFLYMFLRCSLFFLGASFLR